MQQNQDFHPVHACNDGIFNTVSGKKVDLLHPSEEMIDIRDIAASLSKICRFGGHSKHFYSVAQHCVLVAAMAPEKIKREALMHDASEAYLGDVIKPLKVILGASYRNLETVFEGIISQKYGLYTDEWTHTEVKRLDMEALELEHAAFQRGDDLPLVVKLNDLGFFALGTNWTSHVSEVMFLASFAEYFEEPSIKPLEIDSKMFKSSH